jgi:hypothetical protein
LKHAHTESLIVLAGSLMTGPFNGDSLHAESSLFLRDGAVLRSKVRLLGAKIDGDAT